MKSKRKEKELRAMREAYGVKFLLENGIYKDTGNEQVDSFSRLLLADIQFLESRLFWAEVKGEEKTMELEGAESMVDELALLGYRFAFRAFKNEQKPITPSYMLMSLRQLGKFESYLYSKPTERKNESGLLLDKETYFRRLEMLGISREVVMATPSLKGIGDIIGWIESNEFLCRESYIAALIVAAQDYAMKVFNYGDLGGAEELIEKEEDILASRITEVTDKIDKVVGPEAGKIFVVTVQQ